MKLHPVPRAFLRACAALSLGLVACGGGTGRDGTVGTAGTGGTVGSAGTTGSAGRGGTTGTAGTTGTGGTAPSAGGLFRSLLGKAQTDIDNKVNTAVNRFFGIGTGEPTTPTVATGYRCHYEMPQDSSMAFIWAADSNDIRSEGMSYGMMVAVQMNMQTQFDRLWKFAKMYMQFPGDSTTTAWRY